MSFTPNSSRRSQRYRKVKSEMNLTPLIDVMLVLLIIFMVAAPLMTTGISLDLPRVGGKNMTGNDTSVNISVDRDGYYYIGDSEIPDGEMVEKLKAILGANNELTVTISGDTEANYGRVIGLMAILKEAGFEKVGLKTEAKPLGKKTK
ncbi:MAG: biopolymer transporter ExbD [Lactobacillaceae bacterium]|nr:biopolymer transporter ExbD [Lactobacillaceae bacterium]